eukprot:jgi/Tetstr1/431410/TSEL_021100.t1
MCHSRFRGMGMQPDGAIMPSVQPGPCPARLSRQAEIIGACWRDRLVVCRVGGSGDYSERATARSSGADGGGGGAEAGHPEVPEGQELMAGSWEEGLLRRADELGMLPRKEDPYCDGDMCDISFQRQGSILGASLLIAGSALGGGMLAVPSATAAAGCLPSLVTLLGMWAFLLVQGLLLVEVNIAVAEWLERRSASMLSLAQITLGRTAGAVVAASYLIYSNAVLISQISRGGAILSSLVPVLSHTAGVLVVAGSGASLLYFNTSSGIDRTNQALTGLLVLAFVGMLACGMPHAAWDRLLRADWLAAPGTVPTILQVLTFGNLIPVVCTYLDCDRDRTRKAVIIGSFIPTFMVGLWTVMASALVPFAPGAAFADPTDALIGGGGGVVVGALVAMFAGAAVYTTIIGVLMSLHEFWEEALRENATVSRSVSSSGSMEGEELPFQWYRHPGVREIASRIVALAPATLIAVAAPGEVFYQVLAFSGAYVATILFGFAPPLMVMVTRGQRPAGREWLGPDSQRIVPGGNWTLMALGAITMYIVFMSAQVDIPNFVHWLKAGF